MFIYLYIYIMLLMMMLLFILSLYFLVNKFIIIMEFELLKFLSVKIEYLILLDWMSLMFMSVVLMISLSILFYSIEYMSLDLFINRFMNLMMMFVLSMIFMIMSPNLISILMGWDGLGLVSFCLVIYYQNENSFYSGMITVLMNRVGDIMILLTISLMMFLGSWNFMYIKSLNNLMLMLIMITAFTKSAQIPFSSWLPLAMAAPTPVSSLVHSSTLVTAGVYLLIRFNYLMLMSDYFLMILMFISLMTMLMSGLMANLEFDLKKIIALSTLSQLGVMIFSLSLKMSEVSYFHMLTHAMFKSMLFMCSGIIIHNMLLSQDIRYISSVTLNMPLISLIFNCATFSLCGVPFMSGFFSKDKILEMYLMNSMNQFILYILFFCMGMTIMYSIRLVYYSFVKISNMNMFMSYKSISSLMSYSMFLLYLMTLMIGMLLSWLIFSMKNFIYLNLKFKLMIYMWMMLGIFVGLFLCKIKLVMLYLLNINKYLKFLMSLWFMLIIFSMLTLKIFKFMNKFIQIVDLSWNEYFLGGGLMNYLKKIFFMDLYNKNFMFLLILIFYVIMLISV